MYSYTCTSFIGAYTQYIISTSLLLFHSSCIGSNPLLGDLLCVGSGFLYALTTVSEELLIKRNLGIIDFLAMLGFSGTAVSGIQLLVLVCLLITGLSIQVHAYSV